MTNNYHFSCYRTQQDEGETIVLESDSNGLKAAIIYLEDISTSATYSGHLGFVNPPIDKNELVLAKDRCPFSSKNCRTAKATSLQPKVRKNKPLT